LILESDESPLRGLERRDLGLTGVGEVSLVATDDVSWVGHVEEVVGRDEFEVGLEVVDVVEKAWSCCC